MKKQFLALFVSSTALLCASNLFATTALETTSAKHGHGHSSSSSHHSHHSHHVNDCPPHSVYESAYGSFYLNGAKDDRKTKEGELVFLSVKDAEPILFQRQNPSHNIDFNKDTGEIFVKQAGDYVVTYGVTGKQNQGATPGNRVFDLVLGGTTIEGASLSIDTQDQLNAYSLSTTISISEQDVEEEKALTVVNQTNYNFSFDTSDACVAFITLEKMHR